MNVTDKAVEAAARAAYATAESTPWDENPEEHTCWLEEARAGVAAAAPLIAAQALRDAVNEWASDPEPWGDNDKDYRNELLDRADAMERR